MPIIIAIADHDDKYIPEIKRNISKYGEEGKRLALETDRTGSRSDYWGKFWQHAEKMGMEVIPIDSRFAMDLIDPFVEEKAMRAYRSPLDTKRLLEGGKLKDIERQERIRDAKYEYIITTLRDNSMVKRILRTNPHLIVCGYGHIKAIEEVIEVDEIIQVGEYDKRLKQEEMDIAKRIKEMLKERNRKIFQS